MRSFRALLSFAAVPAFFVVTVVACGGIDEPDLFGSSDGGIVFSTDAGGDDARAKDSGPKDSGPPVDAGPPLGSVTCPGTSPCSIAEGQGCCFSPSSADGTCASSASDCSGDTIAVPCDSTQDCTDQGFPDTLCCAQADQSGLVTSVSCVAPINCNAVNGQTNLCDPAAADPCPKGGTCKPSTQSIPGYNICVQ